MDTMRSLDNLRDQLLQLLRTKSVFYGNFTLASGAQSNYYLDCKLTTFDAKGAWLVGELMHTLIRREAVARQIQVDAVGGLTQGADPIALAVAMFASKSGDPAPLRAFSVRKALKAHGQAKRIEGNFKRGDTVVVLEDVVTRGESTISAINAVEQEGGKVAFIAVLVDRQEGGREKIEAMGYQVISVFNRKQLLVEQAQGI